MTTTRSVRAAVLRFARDHDLLRPGPLLVAVSGGTDSTALLLLLADLAPSLGLVLHVAHFDHRLRPRASAADAAFVASLADRCGAPIRAGRAERAPRSEDEARRLRYAFLRRAAKAIGATAIATGHTRDDQAETVLLHAARGSGLAGLAGMRPRRDGVVRPLLAIGRAETALVCREAGVTPREDPSNRSLRYARNRVRQRVLPELERINPRARDALARLADAAAAASDAAEAGLDEALAAATAAGGDVDLERLPEGGRAAVVARAWARRSGRALTARHRAAIATLVASTAGSARVDLPGGSIAREYARIRLAATAETGPRPAEAVLAPERPVEWAGWTILLSERDGDRAGWPLRAPAPGGALVVRARRPGDRLAPPRRTRVQDLFTDAKVPARLRAAHPLVAAEAGEVWWVVGLEHAGPSGVGGRWLLAKPPTPEEPEQSWSLARYTRSIESSDPAVGRRRGTTHEPR